MAELINKSNYIPYINLFYRSVRLGKKAIHTFINIYTGINTQNSIYLKEKYFHKSFKYSLFFVKFDSFDILVMEILQQIV